MQLARLGYPYKGVPTKRRRVGSSFGVPLSFLFTPRFGQREHPSHQRRAVHKDRISDVGSILKSRSVVVSGLRSILHLMVDSD